MRRNAPIIIMIATGLGITALSIFIYIRFRPTVLRAFHDFNTEMPAATAIALSSWFLPAVVFVSAVLTLIALLAPLRRSRRVLLAGVGVVITSIALIFAVVAIFWPIFQPA